MSTLTLKEVIEILTDYDVEHPNHIFSGGECHGLCVPSRELIQISKSQEHDEKRYTVIHELLHASDFVSGYRSSERHTERRTNQVYEELYGHKYMGKRR